MQFQFHDEPYIRRPVHVPQELRPVPTPSVRQQARPLPAAMPAAQRVFVPGPDELGISLEQPLEALEPLVIPPPEDLGIRIQ